MKLGNGGSRGGLVIALCIALSGAGAAAFAACASGEDDGEGAPVALAPDSASPTDSDAKHVTTSDTGASSPDAGATDPDTGGGSDAPDTSTSDVSAPDASAPDTSTPDASAPDTSAPVDAGHEASVDSGSACGGLAEWFAGTTATHVKHNNEKYTCIVPGWCQDAAATSVAAYEPGKGWAWSQAWNDDGACP